MYVGFSSSRGELEVHVLPLSCHIEHVSVFFDAIESIKLQKYHIKFLNRPYLTEIVIHFSSNKKSQNDKWIVSFEST
jgi:hypothetical protein